MELKSPERIALFGIGSGLGEQLARELLAKGTQLAAWSRSNSIGEGVQFHQSDFSARVQWDRIAGEVLKFQPQRVIYVAGGGPYGLFHQKAWGSHEWALNVNFLFPAFLTHALLQRPGIRQMLFVGSAIAESKPDSKAVSYSASKHGLKGLVLNLASEYKDIDVRLFSPGYMKTKMLPENSEAVQKGMAQEPRQVAIEIINWMQENSEASAKHKISQ